MQKREFILTIVMGLLLIGILSCAGGAKEENKVKKFGESFAGYVNAQEVDSIMAVYPTANFDSVAHLSCDSIEVKEEGNGLFKINYAADTWVEVRMGADDSLEVVNSHGIAAFPKGKYGIAMKTGMLNDSVPDIKARELLNDSTYFNWLDDYAKESYKNALAISGGKVKIGHVYGEGNYGVTMLCSITNNLPEKVDSKDYKITYTMVYSGEEGNNWRPTYVKRSKAGVEIASGQTLKYTISDKGESITKPKIELNIPMDEYISKYFKLSGNEYQEYLKSKSLFHKKC